MLLLFSCDSRVEISKAVADAPVIVPSQIPDYKYHPPEVEGEVKAVEKPESYWKEILSEEEYFVLRERGTEPSYSSPLNDENRAGIYTCAASGLPVFTSGAKFNAGTGWPSFSAPLDDAYVRRDTLMRYGVPIVMVSCARSGSHLGYIYNDGPKPTGLRYSINGLALDFVPLEDFPGFGKQ